MELALCSPVPVVDVTDATAPALQRELTADHGGVKVEQWGLCVSCDRWFYCGTNAEQTDGCRCPACDQAPIAIRESWEG